VKYPIRTRVLHWLTAIAVFTTLLIGFTMTNSVAWHGALLAAHLTLGVLILLIVIVRIANRFSHKTPALPATVGRLEAKIAMGSELSLYALLVIQPLVGWAMLSAAGLPIRVFDGIPLPRIVPFDAQLYGVLREAHSVLAYLLVAAVAAHVSAVLLHTLTLRDGMLRRML